MQVLEENLSSINPLAASRVENDQVSLASERLIGFSGWAESARKAIIAHASHNNPIILEGESGTGKEFLARLIHNVSPRRNGSFVAVSFDSISDESAEAVLFGSPRALSLESNKSPRTLLEAAGGGTLYINGILQLGVDLQMKIANYIHRSEFSSSSDDSSEGFDVRIIFGSSRPAGLAAFAESQPARITLGVSDTVSVPPLRQRPEDIEPLVRYFVAKGCKELGKEIRDISSDVLASLRSHDWPGNIVEMKSTVKDMVLKSGPPVIDASLLPSHIARTSGFAARSLPPTGINLNEEIERIEKSLICAALRQAHGVQYKAAKLLGLKPTTLNMKLSRFGIDPRAID